MDYLEMLMNPCSLESIGEPLDLPGNKGQVWPVMVACYELQDTGLRLGRLELFPIKVPDIRSSTSCSIPLQIPKPILVNDSKKSRSNDAALSGILDGKWIKATPSSSSTHNAPSYYFAAAHSTGCISIYGMTVSSYDNKDDDDDDEFPIKIHWVTSTEENNKGGSTKDDGDPSPLCLSLSWDNNNSNSGSLDDATQIVSSYSNGTVKIHSVVRLEGSNPHLQLVERASWVAHTLFTCPAEVWSAAFVGPGRNQTNNGDNSQTVMTGGDDGKLKLWDLRTTTRPMQVLNHFEAGVTVVSPHPRNPYLVACGSYDETMCLYDIRALSHTNKKPLGRSAPLGGGIWRIKWHPLEDDRVLVAAMHGGCRIVKIEELLDDDNSRVFVATTQFTQHKSMAYGADWLVCRHPTREGYFEAAASCSFYDKALYLWDTVA
jgi:diphthine methyl ester acylhydrolase